MARSAICLWASGPPARAAKRSRSMPSASRRPISRNSSAASTRLKRLVGDEAGAGGFDPLEPGLRPLFRRGGVAAAVDIEPAMGAGADPGIFVVAPIDEIVPALGARAGVVGDFVGRQAGRGADLLGQVVERRGAWSASGMASLPAAWSAANGVSGSMVS